MYHRRASGVASRRRARPDRCPDGRSSRSPRGPGGSRRCAIRSLSKGSGELNSTMRSTHSGWRSARSWMTGPPRSPPSSTTRSWPSTSWTSEYTSALCGEHVVEPVRRDVAVAEPTQVRGDHLEPGRRERLDHLPEDPLRLRPAVHRRAARRRSLVHVRLAETRGDARWTAKRSGRRSTGVRHRALSAPVTVAGYARRLSPPRSRPHRLGGGLPRGRRAGPVGSGGRAGVDGGAAPWRRPRRRPSRSRQCSPTSNRSSCPV